MKHIHYQIISLILGTLCISPVMAQLRLSIPDLNTVAGHSIVVPVYSDSSLTGKGIYSYSLELSYSDYYLVASDVITEGTITGDFNAPTVKFSSGKITIAGAGSDPLEGNAGDTLILISFNALQSGGSSLSFTGAAMNYFNEVKTGLTFRNGYISIVQAPKIIISPNTGIVLKGETLQFSVSGSVTPPYSWEVLNSGIGSIDESGLFTGNAIGFTKIKVSDSNELTDETDGQIEVRGYRISIPESLSQWQGDTIDIPINVTSLDGLDIYAGNISITFYQAILSPIELVTEGTLLENHDNPSFKISEGKINIVFAGTSPLSGSGTLVYVRFAVSRQNTGYTSLNLTDVMFNENLAALTRYGSFSTINFSSINLSPSNAILLAGDSLQLIASNGVPPYNWSIDNLISASIDQSGLLKAKRSGNVYVTVTDSVGSLRKSGLFKIYDTDAYFPDTTVAKLSYFDMPLYINKFPADQSISSIQASVQFQSSTLKFVQIVSEETLSNGWKFIIGLKDNILTLAGAGENFYTGNDFTGDVPLLKIRFRIEPGFSFGQSAYVNLTSLYLNEGIPHARLSNGVIRGVTVADFNYTTEGQTVTFTNQSSPNVTKWYYTFGNGRFSTSANPVHTFQPGTYQVCLNVYDGLTGSSGSTCKEIVIGGTPACDVMAEYGYTTNPINSLQYNFNNLTEGNADSWFWNFGDGNTSSAENPQHTFNKPGLYLVSLAAKNKASGCTDYFSDFMMVGAVKCNAAYNHFVIDAEERTVRFKNLSDGKNDLYYWDFGDGNYSTLENPEHTYGSDGNYFVSLTVSNTEGTCMDEVVTGIQVGNFDCSADFRVYIDAETNTAFFTNKSIGDATQLLWIFGDGSYSSEQNPQHTFTVPGYYSVSLNTFNAGNNCMDQFEEIVLIGSLGNDCKADFTFRPDPASGKVVFTDLSIGNITGYSWDFGDGDTSSLQNPEHIYEKAGYRLVCLSITNEFDIPDMNCKWVPVEFLSAVSCKADFNFTVDTLTKKAVFVDNSTGSPDVWKWNFGNGDSSLLSNPQVDYDTAGVYGVRLQVENSTNGCKSIAFKMLNVAKTGSLYSGFTYDTDSTGKKTSGYPVDFVGASSGDGAKYEWDFGQRKEQTKKNDDDFVVMFSGSRIARFVYDKAGSYRACLRVSNPKLNQTHTTCEWIQTSYALGVFSTNDDLFRLNVYPNPSSHYASIEFNLIEPMFIEVAVFDNTGRTIETILKTNKQQGLHLLHWNTGSLLPGMYHLRMTTPLGVIYKPLIIAR